MCIPRFVEIGLMSDTSDDVHTFLRASQSNLAKYSLRRQIFGTEVVDTHEITSFSMFCAVRLTYGVGAGPIPRPEESY